MKSSSTWLLRQKKALAHAIDLNDACDSFGLYVKYDEAVSEGSISLRHTLQLDGFDATQTLSLILRPDNIVGCSILAGDLDQTLNNDKLRLLVDSTVKSVADVISLDVTLRSPGRVIGPLAGLPIQPKEPGQPGFMAFSRLCQATRIRIHIGKQQVPIARQARLQRFVDNLCEQKLRAHEIDLRRLGGGAGAQEVDWHALHPPTLLAPPCYAPPPYEQSGFSPVGIAVDTARTATRKRRRIGSTSPIPYEQKSLKRCIMNTPPPPGSPTELNTPSTQDTTNTESTRDTRAMESNVRPAVPVSSAGGALSTLDLAHVIGGMLQQMLPEMVHQAFTTAFSHVAPAPCPDIDLDDSQPETNAFPPPRIEKTHVVDKAQLEAIVNARLDSVINERVNLIVERKLKSYVDQRLEALISQRLPLLTDAVLQQHMDKVLSNMEHAQAQADVELSEVTDNAILELHQARDQAVDDVQSTVQKGIDHLSDHVDAVVSALDTIQSTAAELKRQLRSLLVRPSLRRQKQSYQSINHDETLRPHSS